jgi:hypothetical protein
LAAANKAGLKKLTARVKQLEEGDGAWRKEAGNRTANLANKALERAVSRMQKDVESQLLSIRERNGPRMDARATAEGEVAALYAQACHDLRLAKGMVADLEEKIEDYAEVERERNALRGLVEELREQVDCLDQVETEGRAAKGRAMQLSQALEKAKAAHAKAVKVKEKKQSKVQVEEGEVEEAATLSDQTMYRRAAVLTGVILDLAKDCGPGFGRLWALEMRLQRTCRSLPESPCDCLDLADIDMRITS